MAAAVVPAQLNRAGPGYRNGELEESVALQGEETVVYHGVTQLIPSPLLSCADYVLKVTAVRGYHKEKPRVEGTCTELQRILEWRKEHDMENMLVRTPPQEEGFHSGWPAQVYGEDCFGHLVFYERIESINVEYLSKNLTKETMLSHRAQIFEALGLEKKLISKRRGYRVYKHISIVDLKNITMSHFGPTVRNLVKHIIGLGSNYYPESLWKLYLINAPTIFRAIWACVKPMIDPVTLAKTFILGGPKDFLPVFQQGGLPLSSIPTALGGSHPGLPAMHFCRQAVRVATAAAARFPAATATQRVPLAVAHVSATAPTLAAAAEEMEALAAQGAVQEFTLPPDPEVAGAAEAAAHPVHASPVRRRPSLEMALRSVLPHSGSMQHPSSPRPSSRGRSPSPDAFSPAAHPLSQTAAAAGSLHALGPLPVAVAGMPPRQQRHARRPLCIKCCFCCCPGCGCGGLSEVDKPASGGGAGAGGRRESRGQALREEWGPEEEDDFYECREAFSAHSGSTGVTGKASLRH